MYKLSYTFLFLILVALSFGPAAYSQDTAQNPNPENLFDFWIGEWEVSWEEPEGATGKGVNIVEKTLDGRVIEENFRITEGQNEGFKGTSISVYQRRTNTWRQAWADNQGGYYDFTGRAEGDKRIFQTSVKELENGRKFTQRMVFYDISEDSLTWDWESSEDGGETWTLNWRIKYKRME